MRRWARGWVVFGVMLAMVTPVAWAQAPMDKTTPNAATDKPGVVIEDLVVVTATVEAVDNDKRTVTLKGPKGNTVALKVGEAARNFDQIHVGDKVKAEYLDSVAVFVRKPGEPPDAMETMAVSVAPKGRKPAAIAVNTVEVTATVEKIDYKQRLVTLKGPEGNLNTIKVDPRVKRLADVKVGDQVVFRRTEAVAIRLTKPRG
jgi:hypothetical protein